MELLQSRSMDLNGRNGGGRKNAYQLSAILKITKGNGGNARGGRSKSNAGGSVTAKPIPPNYSSTKLQPMDAYATSNGSICSACPSTRLPPARGICYQWQPTLEPNIKSERCSHWQEGRLYQEICGMETVTIRNITTINGATTSKVG